MACLAALFGNRWTPPDLSRQLARLLATSDCARENSSSDGGLPIRCSGRRGGYRRARFSADAFRWLQEGAGHDRRGDSQEGECLHTEGKPVPLPRAVRPDLLDGTAPIEPRAPPLLRPRAAPMDQRGGRDRPTPRGRAAWRRRCESMGRDRKVPARAERQAVPRAVAQPARSSHPQGRLVGRGGCHAHRKAGAWLSQHSSSATLKLARPPAERGDRALGGRGIWATNGPRSPNSFLVAPTTPSKTTGTPACGEWRRAASPLHVASRKRAMTTAR